MSHSSADADGADADGGLPSSPSQSRSMAMARSLFERHQLDEQADRRGSEAEYIAAGEAERELRALRNLLSALALPQTSPSPLFVDNTVAIAMAQGEGSHKRRRHIDIKHHIIREQVLNGTIKVEWVPTAEQQADILTKPLPRADFERLRELIMGRELSSRPA